MSTRLPAPPAFAGGSCRFYKSFSGQLREKRFRVPRRSLGREPVFGLQEDGQLRDATARFDYAPQFCSGFVKGIDGVQIGSASADGNHNGFVRNDA